MQLKALPRTFYRAGRHQPAEPSAKADERLHLLRAWEAPRAKGVTVEECSRVLELRELHGWGKDKLVILLSRAGWHVSTSMVGRILCSQKRRGLLREPPRRSVSARKRRPKRPYAARKPRSMR